MATSAPAGRPAAEILVAPDSFKGSIRADRAARAIAEGWRSVRRGDRIRLLPMADGGEGTLDAFAAAVPSARRMPITVTGPSDVEVDTCWLLLPASAEAPVGTAVVELASTSGIELLPQLRPWDAHTLGFGEAVAAAVAHGVSRLVVGIGGSASTDGGAGLLRALGAALLDAGGRPIGDGARGLLELDRVDVTALAAPPPGGVTVLTDVTNPLLGPRGAAAVFGPQKGAMPDDVIAMEAGLRRLAAALPADPQLPGAGAAGGAGFALAAWGARLVPGAPAVAQLIGLPAAVPEATLVITGEGSFDGQSVAGKAPAHVAQVAAAHGVPVALVVGRVTDGTPVDHFDEVMILTEIAGSREAAMAEPERWLRAAGARLAGTVRL